MTSISKLAKNAKRNGLGLLYKHLCLYVLHFWYAQILYSWLETPSQQFILRFYLAPYALMLHLQMTEFTSNLSDYPSLADSQKGNSWIRKGPHQNVEFRFHPAQGLVTTAGCAGPYPVGFQGSSRLKAEDSHSGKPVRVSDHPHCQEFISYI